MEWLGRGWAIPPCRAWSSRNSCGEHLLVYQTATTNRALPDVLKRFGRPARIYGLRRDLKEDLVENLVYRPFGEAQFIEDLRTARACGGRRFHLDERSRLPSQAVTDRAQLPRRPTTSLRESNRGAGPVFRKPGAGQMGETDDVGLFGVGAHAKVIGELLRREGRHGIS